jgi:branched-chain amino acid transport system permease protein
MDQKVAYFWGIDQNFFYKIAYVIVAILIGMSAFSLLFIMDVSIQTAPEITLLCFIIVILGGLGSFFGTFTASLIIGVLEALISYYGASVYKSFFTFLIFIIILIFNPQGLFGKK